MLLRKAYSAVKARTVNRHDKLLTCPFIFCTLWMLASVIRMCSHWSEIAAAFGVDRAAGVPAGLSGTTLVISRWVDTGND